MLRGAELEAYSVFQFFTDTYDTEVKPSEREDVAQTTSDQQRRPGRPRNLRCRYIAGHPCQPTKQRILRSAGHRNLLNVVGRWFPRSDDPDGRDAYCASMLLLLKPWREPRSDLKADHISWEEAFAAFMCTATQSDRYVVSGAQYFHECALAAEADRRDEDSAEQGSRRDRDYDIHNDGDDEYSPATANGEEHYTEEGLAMLKAMQTSLAERVHAYDALAVARHAKLFPENHVAAWPLQGPKLVAAATGDELRKLEGWRVEMADDVQEQARTSDGSAGEARRSHLPDVVAGVPDAHASTAPTVRQVPPDDACEEALPAVDVSCLRDDQYRAYDIILWHLEHTLSGAQVPPLRMIIYGEGGTGKSRVIQTVTEAFARRGCSYMLVKAAYTGIAASLIDGKTTHIIGHVGVGNKERKVSDETRRLLQAFWRGKRYLVIDEYSMLAKSFVARLARNIAIGMEGSGLDSDQSFGGLSVILCGDLHQFPPVAVAAAEALYMPTVNERDLEKADRVLGRKIYEEFTTVVVLKEQMRVSDPVWRDFLVHLRYGRVEKPHLAMLRTLLITNPDQLLANAAMAARWHETSLVTPRHAVRIEWNAAAVRKACQDRGERVYVVTAEDRIKGQPLTLRERHLVVGRLKTQKGQKRRDLPEVIELAIGMKVMVTSNIQTDLDLANGARGEVVDIVLHPDEEVIGPSSVVHLKYLPSYVLVKMLRTRASQLQGLDDHVIPVEPAQCHMQIQITRSPEAPLKRTVTRRQFPMTPAYAFTDYRSQGQTIPFVLVDIKSPPGPQKLSLFNLYVALSRSSGRQTIRLLRDFDDQLFLQVHEQELLDEDQHLEDNDKKTKTWWSALGRAR